MKSRRFLLALAHPGSPGKRARKWLCECLKDNMDKQEIMGCQHLITQTNTEKCYSMTVLLSVYVSLITRASVTLNSRSMYCGMLYSAIGSTTKYWYRAERSLGQYWWHLSCNATRTVSASAMFWLCNGTILGIICNGIILGINKQRTGVGQPVSRDQRAFIQESGRGRRKNKANGFYFHWDLYEPLMRSRKARASHKISVNTPDKLQPKAEYGSFKKYF